ncbi:hypothetical protein R80B4_02313 [Fibrobacteres bacterium R8-0-B4]
MGGHFGDLYGVGAAFSADLHKLTLIGGIAMKFTMITDITGKVEFINFDLIIKFNFDELFVEDETRLPQVKMCLTSCDGFMQSLNISLEEKKKLESLLVPPK